MSQPAEQFFNIRERPDTIWSIVVGDDDSSDSPIDENKPAQPLQQLEVEDDTDPNWKPEPIDAEPAFRTNKPSDVIISTLVSLQDSEDLFVEELQVLFAQRLLTLTKDDTERVKWERRNIEIIKVRFGEAALQVCEVMLRDMTDSKRIDGHSIVHPTILSRQFIGDKRHDHAWTISAVALIWLSIALLLVIPTQGFNASVRHRFSSP